MTISLIREVICPAIDSLLVKLDGFYKDHVSDKFIGTYIMDKFIEIYKENPKFGIKNIAYRASQPLFELYLEHGCGVRKNGHHTAQLFCDQLTPEIQEKFEILNKSVREIIKTSL